MLSWVTILSSEIQRWQLCTIRWWPWPRFRFQKFGLKAGNKKHPSALSLSNEETWYTFRQFKLVERRDEERAELASDE